MRLKTLRLPNFCFSSVDMTTIEIVNNLLQNSCINCQCVFISKKRTDELLEWSLGTEEVFFKKFFISSYFQKYISFKQLSY